MKIYIFGNKDVQMDSLPVQLMGDIQKEFPDTVCEHMDANEDLDIEEPFIIVDTVVGLKEVMLFNSLKDFTPPPNFTCHDFDVFANLKLLEKLGRLPDYRIIGVPPMFDKKNALVSIVSIIKDNQL